MLPTFGRLCVWALAVRLAVIGVTELQGRWQGVDYTDVDYVVLTDAARFVVEGGSPFDRATYRYTPLLAYMLVPNLLIANCAGKMVFAGVDLVVAWLIVALVKGRGGREKDSLLLAASWLFSPLTINVSTRGNADAVTVALVLAVALLLLRGRWELAAAVFGLAVHFRLYPVVFAFSCLFVVWDLRRGRHWADKLKALLLFTAISGGVFLSLAAFFYWLYGFRFLHEAYLFHALRRDNRHNFSVFFYELYLRFGRDLPFAMLAQTWCFVHLNKVVTAQYFLWYAGLLPVAMAKTSLTLRWEGLAMLLAWITAEVHWLHWAYRLEFEGQSVFRELWLAGVIFFVVNATILARVISHHHFTPLANDAMVESKTKTQ